MTDGKDLERELSIIEAALDWRDPRQVLPEGMSLGSYNRALAHSWAVVSNAARGNLRAAAEAEQVKALPTPNRATRRARPKPTKTVAKRSAAKTTRKS